MFEPGASLLQDTKIQALETILPSSGSRMYVSVVNHLGLTQKIPSGAEIGAIQPVQIVEPEEDKVT